MASAWCLVCNRLVGISPNGADPSTTNKRQKLDVHKLPGKQELCPGSGKDV